MNIFLLNFSRNTEFRNQFTKGEHNITEENENGNFAYQVVAELKPDLIFVNYDSKPSHCRQTILAINKRKSTNNIPTFFVGGKPSEIDKVIDLGMNIKLNR